MSDSELSEPSAPTPPDSKLEAQLRREVQKRFKNGTTETMTVNEIRQAAEKSLGLVVGFYASHTTWKSESKRVVKDEMENQASIMSSPAAPAQHSPAKVPTRSKPAKPSNPSKPSNAQKRQSADDNGRAKKRVKKSKLESEAEDDLSSLPSDIDKDEEEVKPKAKSRAKPQPKKSAVASKVTNGGARNIRNLAEDSESALSASVDVQSEAGVVEDKKSKPVTKDGDSESEMSVLLDEEPKSKKKKRQSSDAPEKGPKKARVSKPAKAEATIDPAQEEIKRLQGWLVKCGIRKLWGKELKPYESSKAKISHLKDMLSEAGMTSRYSVEKAAQIKEARELAADIEAVKEGAERWGKGTDDDDDDDEDMSKRRIVKGAKLYDFLSSDGEETD